MEIIREKDKKAKFEKVEISATVNVKATKKVFVRKPLIFSLN